MDHNETGPTWLRQQEIAEIVKEAIHYRDGNEFDLYAYTIMPNHVHLVFKHLMDSRTSKDTYPVTEILRKLKRYTARECNKLLQRTGSFWQAESFDRVIRNTRELESTIAYTLNNPVKARLVKSGRIGLIATANLGSCLCFPMYGKALLYTIPGCRFKVQSTSNPFRKY